MKYQDISFKIADPVALITINRPSRLNAFSFTTLNELRDAFITAANNPRVVGIVVTGAGTAFSVGMDSAELTAAADGQLDASMATYLDDDDPALFGYVMSIPKPVIAAVNGICVGGGLVLALSCDLRFASKDAVFSTIFSQRGLNAEHGTSWLLPRLIGLSNTLDLLWSSRRVTATEAVGVGLVNRVVDATELVHTARDYIRALTDNVAPSSLAATKRLVYRHAGMQLAEATKEADVAMRAALQHPDFREGVLSFLERRSPRFSRLPAPE